MKMFVMLIILSFYSCTNEMNNKNKEFYTGNSDELITYILPGDLITVGSFDFGSVNQGASLSKIVTYKNNSLANGKIMPDLTELNNQKGLFSVNYATSDCIVGTGAKVLKPGKTCQIEILVSPKTEKGYIAFGLPLYDPLNGNTLIQTMPVSVVVQAAADLITSPVKPCITNYHKDPITNKCVSDYKDCTANITNATSAKKHWDSGTSTWGVCTVNSCSSLYSPVNNSTSCALSNQDRSCINQPQHSIGGVESTIDGGITWSNCSNFSCDQGYAASFIGTCELPPILTNSQSNLTSNGNPISLVGSCESGLNVIAMEGGAQIASAVCENNAYVISYPVINTQGLHNVYLYTLKNGVESSILIPYIVDSIAPSITLNMLNSINTTNNLSYTISGTCSENASGISVQLTDSASHVVTANSICLNNIYSFVMDTSLLIDGPIWVNLQAVDSANNYYNLSSETTKSLYLPGQTIFTFPVENYATNVITIATVADSVGNFFTAGYTAIGLDGNAQTGTNDLFVMKYNASGVKQWTRQIGVSTKNTYTMDASIDPSGNIYVTGYTYGNLDGNVLTGAYDLFVIKYDTNGVKLWSRLLGAVGKVTLCRSIATDSNGNSYVTGYTNGNLDGNILVGTSDRFIVKYDVNGIKQWTKTQGVATKDTRGLGVAVDSYNNIYVSGYSSGNLDGNTVVGFYDMALSKYSPDGSRLWTKMLGSTPGASTNGIIVGAAGNNVYIVGTTTGALDGNALIGTTDTFLTKYDNNGTKLWTRQLGVIAGVLNPSQNGLVITNNENIYLLIRSVNGYDGMIPIGLSDSYLAKFNQSGIKQNFTQQFGVLSKSINEYGLSLGLNDTLFIVGSLIAKLKI